MRGAGTTSGAPFVMSSTPKAVNRHRYAIEVRDSACGFIVIDRTKAVPTVTTLPDYLNRHHGTFSAALAKYRYEIVKSDRSYARNNPLTIWLEEMRAAK